MAKRAVKLIFPQNLITQPLTFQMAKRFDIMPNLRRAKVTETAGEIVLELEGSAENIAQGIQFLEQQGVQVTAVEGDIVE